MIGYTVKAAKEGFFDRVKVIDATDKASLRVLSKFGAYVRTSARGSMRRRRQAAPAGQPPSAHVGLLKTLMFFSYAAETRSVVIGPALSNRPSGAPATLEYSGEAEVTNRKGRTEKVQIEARPFMGPALAKEEPKLPGMWKDAIRP